MTSATAYIGQAISRVDGRAKVTGEAKYAAEFHVPGLAHGVVVSSPIARGRITRIDATEALALDGVLQVFTHENVTGVATTDEAHADAVAPAGGSPFRPLCDAEIQYSGQPVALVVAESFELARYAATLVSVDYEPAAHETSLLANREQAYVPEKYRMPPPRPRGDAAAAFADAPMRVEAEYTVPVEHHNPMEPFASTVRYEDDAQFTIFEKTQGVLNTKRYVCSVFGFSEDTVRIVSPFVGGAFGSGLRPNYQLFMAVLAARDLKRSVKVVLTRQQMFTIGHRPNTVQRIALGASEDGKLLSLSHEALGETSRFEAHNETVVNWSGLLYQCDNFKSSYKLVALDLRTPQDMRAPGAPLGLFALESALDELAYELGMDPLELRLKNYAERDPIANKPFTSKALRECYAQGAEKFRWSRRDPEPRSMRDGDRLVGWGMASGVWEAITIAASAKASLSTDGRLHVSSATSDIGTGTYTIMTQIAAETLGLPIEDVTFNLGDTSLPKSPLEGGSFTAASVGSAVKLACERVREELFALAKGADDSPFAEAALEDVTFADGQIHLSLDSSKAMPITEAMRRGGNERIEQEARFEPSTELSDYSRNCHSAVFAEVKVDEALGTIRVTRVVSAVAAGNILNPKTAANQIVGSVVWGLGMALEEEAVLDHRFGRFVNHNLAEYHVPVNADVGDIEVIFVEEHDSIINPLGVKGVGEIGIVGVAPAIANAVFHATGRRVRDLPITPDKVL